MELVGPILVAAGLMAPLARTYVDGRLLTAACEAESFAIEALSA